MRLNADPARLARHLRIRGRVQGVFYRQWMCNTAEKLCLDGWVRNRADGSVEAIVAGPREAVEAMIAAAHLGPHAAAVSAIDDEEWAEPVEAGFRKFPTL